MLQWFRVCQSEMHSTLMTAMGVIFFLGANGGIVLSLVQDKPITESVHFTTAMIGFAMLAAQGSITKLFSGAVTLLSHTSPFSHTTPTRHAQRARNPHAKAHTHSQTERAVGTNCACLFRHRDHGPLPVPCFSGKKRRGIDGVRKVTKFKRDSLPVSCFSVHDGGRGRESYRIKMRVVLVWMKIVLVWLIG
jgi:hypothetical protein